jgi:F-type H+-transporting ATPase subunit epsilon
MQVELVSPEEVLYSGEAEMVVCRTIGGGEIAFLAGHEPFLGALGVGQVRVIRSAGDEDVFAVHRGFVEVAHDKVIVLSDVAELQTTIDRSWAERSKAAAEAALQSDPDDADALAALARAQLRIEVLDRS